MNYLFKSKHCLLGGMFLLLNASNVHSKDMLMDIVIELETPPESKMNVVESIDVGGEACDNWVSSKGWRLGENYKKDGNLVLVFKDDGRGIDLEKLRIKALEIGKWDENEINNWDETREEI